MLVGANFIKPNKLLYGNKNYYSICFIFLVSILMFSGGIFGVYFVNLFFGELSYLSFSRGWIEIKLKLFLA
jgi:hypothetical protein